MKNSHSSWLGKYNTFAHNFDLCKCSIINLLCILFLLPTLTSCMSFHYLAEYTPPEASDPMDIYFIYTGFYIILFFAFIKDNDDEFEEGGKIPERYVLREARIDVRWRTKWVLALFVIYKCVCLQFDTTFFTVVVITAAFLIYLEKYNLNDKVMRPFDLARKMLYYVAAIDIITGTIYTIYLFIQDYHRFMDRIS